MQADAVADTVEQVAVTLGAKGRLAFEVETASDREACFSLGVRKSGSTMLHRIVISLARRNGVNVVDVPGACFRHGMTVPDWVDADLSAVVRRGNAYVGFRTFPANVARYAPFRGGRKILMVRDPRDALVSEYFSDAYSHSLPSSETETGAQAAEDFLKRRAGALATDVESYVLRRARPLAATLLDFEPLLDDPNCLLLRYEDYVFQKKRLIHKILAQFGWTCPPGAVEALLRQIDEVPEIEDTRSFVRRVIPGDHRSKLAPETIRKLDNQLGEVLRLYDYY